MGDLERQGAVRAFRQAADECDIKAAAKRSKAAEHRQAGHMELAVRAEESAHQMHCMALGFRHSAALEDQAPERADRMRERVAVLKQRFCAGMPSDQKGVNHG
jgi:hypothetical protein